MTIQKYEFKNILFKIVLENTKKPKKNQKTKKPKNRKKEKKSER